MHYQSLSTYSGKYATLLHSSVEIEDDDKGDARDAISPYCIPHHVVWFFCCSMVGASGLLKLLLITTLLSWTAMLPHPTLTSQASTLLCRTFAPLLAPLLSMPLSCFCPVLALSSSRLTSNIANKCLCIAYHI